MPTTPTIADRRAEIAEQLAATRTEYEDAALAATTDPRQRTRAAKLGRDVAALEDEARALDAAEQAARRQTAAEHVTAAAAERQAAMDSVVAGVSASQVLIAEIQRDAEALADKVARLREAERAAHRAAGRLGATLGYTPDLVLPVELLALCTAAATGQLGDVEITRLATYRAGRLLDMVRVAGPAMPVAVVVEAVEAAAVT